MRYKSETSLVNATLTAHGARDDLRLWRNETSGAWVGKYKGRNRNGDVVLSDARLIQAGLCKGSADIIGIHSRVIQPDDVGSRAGVFVAAEAKQAKGRVTKQQQAFLDTVTRMGGAAGVLRDPDDINTILGGE